MKLLKPIFLTWPIVCKAFLIYFTMSHRNMACVSQPQDSICPQSCSGTLTLWPAHTHVAALSQAECPGHSVLGSQLSPCFVNSAGAGKAGMLC